MNKKILKEFIQNGFSLAKLDSIKNYLKRLAYCHSFLGQEVGEGCGRIVFEIGDGEVIKIVKNQEKGIEQNKQECLNYKLTKEKFKNVNELFPKIFQVADDYSWLTCERVLPFQKEDSQEVLNIPYFSNNAPSLMGFIDWVENSNIDNSTCSMAETMFYEELITKNKWFADIYQYIRLTHSGITDLFADNFGLALRNKKPCIVILDNGFDNLSEQNKNLNKIIKENVDNFILQEKMGVPNGGMNVAAHIVCQLINELDNIESDLIDLMIDHQDDEDEYDDSWQDEFEYEFYVADDRDYCIELFYDKNSRKKADTDGDGTISINFAPINKIVESCHDAYDRLIQKGKKGFDVVQAIETRIYSYLYPIILHELTHNEDKEGGKDDHIWLSQHNRYNEDYLREILYLFADNELNARIGSSAAIMDDYLEQVMNKDENISNDEIREIIENAIINDDELRISDMESYLNILKMDLRDAKDFHSKYRVRDNLRDKQDPYSLAYDLYRCDSRLKKNRNIKRLFNQNYIAGVKYVYVFYNNLFERYKNKIRRACYYAVQRFKGEYQDEEY